MVVDKPAGPSYTVEVEGFEQACPMDFFRGDSRTTAFLEGLAIVDPSALGFFIDLHAANFFTGCTWVTAGGNMISRTAVSSSREEPFVLGN